MAAAPILLVLGITDLWSSRRLDDGLARRYGRRLLKTAGVLVLVALFALPLSIAYVGSHVTRADVPEANLGAAVREREVHHE